jgi:hypothetical protein
VETIRAVLKKELDLPIVEIGDESAKLDGGDVLFTGTGLGGSSCCVTSKTFMQGKSRIAVSGGCVHASVISMSDNLDEWIVVGFYIKNI